MGIDAVKLKNDMIANGLEDVDIYLESSHSIDYESDSLIEVLEGHGVDLSLS